MGICNETYIIENTPKPDLNYDFLIKKNEQKDLLDIYKPKEVIHFSKQIKCPLCKIMLPEEERKIIEDKLNFGGEKKLLSLINKFNNEVESKLNINNIIELENIYIQIQNYFKTIEENRFYKHICRNNDICNRTNNQEIYIDLCTDSIKDNLENLLKIDINKLKTDQNYKNKYLQMKQFHIIITSNKKKKKKFKINIKMNSNYILSKKNKVI